MPFVAVIIHRAEACSLRPKSECSEYHSHLSEDSPKPAASYDWQISGWKHRHVTGGLFLTLQRELSRIAIGIHSPITSTRLHPDGATNTKS